MNLFLNKKLKELFFILLLLIVSVTIRIYSLGAVPNGLTVDEADMGYNAYSILKTGKDVYGRSYPLFFQSLDDYKPGFAIYATIPAIKLFGLSDFSIRLFPALLGVFSPILIFFLIRLLYIKPKPLSYIASALTVLAPWNIAISRATFMYIELIFFYLLFWIFLLLGIHKNPKFFILSAFLLGVTLYVYYAAIIYLPLVVLSIAIIYRQTIVKNFKTIIFSFFVLLVVSLPALVHYANLESKSRLNAISVFTPDISLPASIKEMEMDQKSGDHVSTTLHNRRLVNFSDVLNNYFDYFNFDYLFVNSKSTRYFYTNYVGLLYLLEIPSFLYGLYILIKRREKSDLSLLSLLMIGPLPAAITLGSPLPHRGILLILAVQIISALGVASAYQNLARIRFKKALIIGGIFIYSLNVYFFLHQYFVHSPHEFTTEVDNGAWFSTVRDIIPKVNTEKAKYDEVVFTWSSSKLVPPVYFLFYNKIDPKILQTKASGWAKEPPSYRQIYDQIGNIQFRPIAKDEIFDKNKIDVLYEEELPKIPFKILSATYLPNGKRHFVIIQPD